MVKDLMSSHSGGSSSNQQLGSFLGLMNCYVRLVKNVVVILGPMHEPLHTGLNLDAMVWQSRAVKDHLLSEQVQAQDVYDSFMIPDRLRAI